MKPIITVEGVSKRYIIGKKESYGSLRDEVMDALLSPFRRLFGGAEAVPDPSVWALKDVSFEVFEGDVLGIIGRNGAGKSTLLKILSRITEPTEGRIEMRGRIASLLEVGTGFHPELTGRENIFMNGALLGMSSREIKAKFDEIVAFSEIEKFLDTPVKRYSSGMYVRLAFAVAAHLEPEILIVDEVLAVGDTAFQKKCLGKMGEVAEGGRTVLFVSHNMAAVKQLCDRACLIADGKMIFQGSPFDTVSKYLQEASVSDQNPNKIYHHIKGDGRARIQKLYFNDFPNIQPVVSVFDSIKISIEYTLNEPISELEFFVLIYSSDGEVVASLFQRDSGKNTMPVSGEGTVSLKFQNYLLPGNYLISAGIFDKSRQFIDWVEFIGSFMVDQTFEDGRVSDNRLGKVSFLGKWES